MRSDHLSDQYYKDTARKSSELLFDCVKEKTDTIPLTYLDPFDHEYSEGISESYLDQIDKLDFGNVKYNEEVRDQIIDKLIEVQYGELPPKEDIEAILVEEILYGSDGDVDFDEFDELEYAEGDDFANGVSKFLKTVISSIYTPGVTSLDPEPSEDNNFLANDDVTAFTGVFKDNERTFNFKLAKEGKTWALSYKRAPGN